MLGPSALLAALRAALRVRPDLLRTGPAVAVSERSDRSAPGRVTLSERDTRLVTFGDGHHERLDAYELMTMRAGYRLSRGFAMLWDGE